MLRTALTSVRLRLSFCHSEAWYSLTIESWAEETIKVSPFRKAKVLDIIIDWHQRNQMQSETIAYNLDRIYWLLENPDQDWEDYDDLTADDFSAETRPDVVENGCPVCETELVEVSEDVLRCDRCEIAWDLIVDEEGFEYLDSESDDSEDYGVEPRWMWKNGPQETASGDYQFRFWRDVFSVWNPTPWKCDET